MITIVVAIGFAVGIGACDDFFGSVTDFIQNIGGFVVLTGHIIESYQQLEEWVIIRIKVQYIFQKQVFDIRILLKLNKF